MRQRLINKTEPQETSLPSSRIAGRSAVVAEATSLQSLLFDSNISREEWVEGLKHHSKILTNLLLNDQVKEFDQYLRSEFSSELPEGKKGLKDIDYRPVLQDLLQTAILIEHSTIPPYLTALYSIQDGTNALASQIIRSVAVEDRKSVV